jgi:hypothetical protein
VEAYIQRATQACVFRNWNCCQYVPIWFLSTEKLNLEFKKMISSTLPFLFRLIYIDFEGSRMRKSISFVDEVSSNSQQGL